MRSVLMLFILAAVAFALGSLWYFAFDVYATQGAEVAGDWVGGAIAITILVAIVGGIAASEMD